MRSARRQFHGLRTALTAGVLLAVLSLAPPARAGAQVLPDSKLLSDERTFTRWAHAEEAAPVRAAPNPNAWRVATLPLSTEDGLPEVFPLLRDWTDEAGDQWVQVRIPMRPKAMTGWVEASAFGRI